MPDVYHGSPTAATLLVGNAPKLAVFAMMLHVLVEGLSSLAYSSVAHMGFLSLSMRTSMDGDGPPCGRARVQRI
ncbi:hypothetical protein SZ30_31700, partial [Burkholderia pseudomallei]